MALEKQISKAQFDALPSHFQSEYKASGENFVLDIVGDDGIDWKRKREIEAEHRRKAEKDRDDANEKLDEMRRGAIPKDDVAALEDSWKTKLTAAEQKHLDEVNNLQNVIANATIMSAARDVSSLFLAPEAMIPLVRQRLKTEIKDGVAITRVLDKNGQPSAMSLEDLKNEYKADTSLAPVLVGSQGSGGGGGSGNGGAGSKQQKPFKDLNDQERKDLFATDPKRFRELAAAQ